jgi:hypothetical protein
MMHPTVILCVLVLGGSQAKPSSTTIGPCYQELMEVKKMPGAFFPTCEADGYFSRLQCHFSTGQCWCVDPHSGKEIMGTRRGPGQGSVNCNDNKVRFLFEKGLNTLRRLKKRSIDSEEDDRMCEDDNANKLAEAVIAMHRKLSAMEELVGPMVNNADPSMAAELQTLEVELSDFNEDEIRMAACQLSSIKSLADLAKLLQVPLEEVQTFYPMITMVGPNIIGILRDFLTVFETMAQMNLFNLN